jgi:hypothetical protein
MNFTMKEKLLRELTSIFWTSLYFFSWFGGLMMIKVLLLREYHIEFVGFTMVVVGALVVAKVVLVLEYVPMPFTAGKPAWREVLVRTLLYLSGVFVVMVLEKSFEARHEYDGVWNAFIHLTERTNIYHILVNSICVFGALILFNIWTIAKKQYGKGMLWKILNSPVPDSSQSNLE